MILPARGGELLRILYTSRIAHMPVAEIVSRVILEKSLDLFFVACIGICGMVAIGSLHRLDSRVMLSGLALPLIVFIAGGLVLKTRPEPLLELLRRTFTLLRRDALFERHVSRLIADFIQAFTPRLLWVPFALSFFIWFAMYAGTYWVAGKFVGIDLTYPEVLIVVCAGALGLMLPAAPSGLGTFHASVVSAFLLIGRSPLEGLLLGTAVHLLYFIAIGLPSIPLFLYSHFKTPSPRPFQ
jgi:hypothetical protein